MSQKANPTLIGVFVFGAILIAIGAAVFFGSADFFSKKQTYVSYFNQSEIQVLRVFATFLHGRCAIAMSDTAKGANRKSYVDVARKDVKQLRRERVLWA